MSTPFFEVGVFIIRQDVILWKLFFVCIQSRPVILNVQKSMHIIAFVYWKLQNRLLVVFNLGCIVFLCRLCAVFWKENTLPCKKNKDWSQNSKRKMYKCEVISHLLLSLKHHIYAPQINGGKTEKMKQKCLVGWRYWLR